MINTLLTFHDIIRLTEKIRERGVFHIIKKIFGNDTVKITSQWQRTHNVPKNWWDIPAVCERWNTLITGSALQSEYQYVAQKYFNDKKNLKALSLGCGTGGRELEWAKTKAFIQIDALDLSTERIAEARTQAKSHHLDHIVHYYVADAHEYPLRTEHYDVIFAEGSLHHFSPLEKILQRIYASVAHDGIFIINEYVGPSRFQWTDKQLHEANTLLSRLPEQYRRKWNSRRIKRKEYRPGILPMIINDPSEAIESDHIVPLVQKIFSIEEFKPYGGTILQLVLKDIAHNFLSDDAETQRWLRVCFEYEDALLSSHELESDFAFIVCRRKNI